MGACARPFAALTGDSGGRRGARLEDAVPEEAARVTALYSARLKELEATGS
ncbi:hypothetical protein [Streptomyces sp. NPDC056304]|uniref:hypothetical protein n=1 Tax=Streptomyces sp. NPDC056304 TaxID=3345778 RepID=UPI0035D70425